MERRLLAKMFTPEEAALVAIMRLAREPAADIAARAGVDVDEANRTLKAMARKGLIVAERGKGSLAFRLMPFVVGIYEAQLPYLDAEYVLLRDSSQRGRVLTSTPSSLTISARPARIVSPAVNSARSQCPTRKRCAWWIIHGAWAVDSA